MHADVNEGAEVDHVGDDAGAGHSGLQILDRVNVLAVGEGGEFFARVASRFGELGDDVRESEFADLRFELFGLPDQFDAAGGQVGHTLTEPLSQSFQRGVTLRVYAG